MKSRTLTCITAMVLFAPLALPVRFAAHRTHYKLIDIVTFDGPRSDVGSFRHERPDRVRSTDWDRWCQRLHRQPGRIGRASSAAPLSGERLPTKSDIGSPTVQAYRDRLMENGGRSHKNSL